MSNLFKYFHLFSLPTYSNLISVPFKHSLIIGFPYRHIVKMLIGTQAELEISQADCVVPIIMLTNSNVKLY